MLCLCKTAVSWLTSLGITLLVLSVVLVPTSTMLADSGSGRLPLAPACIGNDGCNSGGCTLSPQGTCPNVQFDNVNCQWSLAGCFQCTCMGCWPQGRTTICACQCRTVNYGCNAQLNDCTQ
jgi:hypothetical protein